MVPIFSVGIPLATHSALSIGQATANGAVSVVVITSALHAEGRQFEPGTAHIYVLADLPLLFRGVVSRMSGWPSGLRRQTQGQLALFPGRERAEISGPLLRAWVRIPHLTDVLGWFFVCSRMDNTLNGHRTDMPP